MNATDEIKSRLDIVDVVSDHVQLRKSGQTYSGFCPFHSNTRTPAFVVFPDTQTWYCFGACAEGGDLFTFMMKKQGWDFKEALQQLASRAGVVLEEPSPEERRRQAAADRLGDLLAEAADYYHQLLLHAPQAEGARTYVRRRDLSDETLATFRVGFALDSWDACRSHFNSKGYSNDDLLDAGLLTYNEERQTSYDRFRQRLMIPIRDVSGRIVGFGARTLDPDGVPKYLNSPQTALFDKSRLLFGLDLAKREIREQRQVVIVEGYMDVMQAWQAGFHNVVAQMGTSLTEAQLRLAKRYSKRFVLALDADAAGANATLRSLEVARDVLDRSDEVHFDARGLVRHEGRLQAEIYVVNLPEGKDPDDIIRANPQRWQALVDEAKPVVSYVIDAVMDDLDRDDPKAKTAAAQQILPLINDVAAPLEREHYRQVLARRLGVDERVLRAVAVGRGSRSAPRRPAAPPAAQQVGLVAAMQGNQSGSDLRRENFLRQCLAHPFIVGQIDRQLALHQLRRVEEGDFNRPEDQALWRYVRERDASTAVVGARELCDSLQDEVLCQRLKQLLQLESTPETQLDRLPDLLVLSVIDWRLDQLKALLSNVRQLLSTVHQQEDEELLSLYRQQLRDLPLEMRRLNHARDAMSAMGQRAKRDRPLRHTRSGLIRGQT
ncbi:MAG: DNA primase [Candidatus Promineifilaceae bacterium]|nr:DNA primase [Candidatus Promineifilaceae bacterium]